MPFPRHESKETRRFAIYQKAPDGIVEVSALLRRPSLGKDFDLRDQLSESSGRIPGHIAEGYGQLTDRHFAKYLGIARGSAKETRGHLAVAYEKDYVAKDDLVRVSGLYEDLGAMLTSFISPVRLQRPMIFATLD